MRIFNIFLLIIFAASLSACGNRFSRLDKSEFTNVTIVRPKKFQNGSSFSTQALAGGIMVYAVNVNATDRRGSLFLDDTSDSYVWSIPSGRYRFASFGYDSLNMSGNVYCGLSDEIDLTGFAQTVQIVVNQMNCGQPPFTEPGWNDGGLAPNLKFATCGTSQDMGAVSIGSPCAATDIGTGPFEFQIHYPEYEAWTGELEVADDGVSGGPEGVESACVPAQTNTPATISVRIIPGTSSQVNPFAVGMHRFDNSAICNGATKSLYGYARGLSNFYDLGKMIFEKGSAEATFAQPMSFVGFLSSFVYLYTKNF